MSSLPTPTDPAAAVVRRRDALRNEAQIVAAAMRVLADDPEATMQHVADAAGLGRATVYRHFPTREALTAAIGRAAIAEVGALLEASRLDEGDPLDALGRAIEAIFAVGDRYRVIAHAAPVAKGPDGCERQPAVGAMDALVRRAQREGALDPGPPAEWILAAAGAVISAAFAQLAGGAIAREDAPRLVRDAILGGFGASREAALR